MNAHARYAAVLKPLIPPEAFRRRPVRLVYPVIHLAIVVSIIWVVRISDSIAVALIGSLLVGHSLACLAFFAHELSHNAILKRGPIRQCIEILLWGMNLIPATLWDEVHNQSHHVHVNTLNDPDRRFLAGERPATNLYTRLFYPHCATLRWNPLVFVQFLGYISRNIIAALSGGDCGMMPATPNYTAKERIRIAAEVLLIAALQAILFVSVGYHWFKYVCVGPIALAIASCVVMAYVFTNHFLDPLADEDDPLRSSTSVIVPKWIDWLHCRFSYHTEHHLFPSMDSHYYPILSDRLRDCFPILYKRITIGQAWQRLWKSHPYAASTGAVSAAPARLSRKEQCDHETPN